MRNKLFFILILVLSFGLLNASAQTTPPLKKISGGVLNGKAVSLAKPSYPAAARAVNAGGAVNVQVVIDENGDVISATAISGHPLLRQASEKAALASKFAPTKLEGQPVSVTGVIVYNFVPAMTFTQIGYELSLAEKTKSLSKSQLSSIRGAFPQTWEEEKEAVKKLDSRLLDKDTKEKAPPKLAPINSNNPVESRDVEGIKRTVQGDRDLVGTIAVDQTYPLDDDSITVIRELQSKLENRLSVNENMLWSFRLGIILGKLKAEIDSDQKTRVNVSQLNQLGANKPTGISESVAAKVKELVELSEQTTSDTERAKKLLPLIENLRNLKVI